MANTEYTDYTFNNLSNIIASSDRLQDVESINAYGVNRAWLTDVLLQSLSDSNPCLTGYNNDSIENIINLLVDFYNSSWDAYFDIASGDVDIEKLLNYTRQDRYTIQAADGIRVATKKEVEEGIYQLYEDSFNNGVIQLINQPTIALEDSEVKFLLTFTWAVTGRWRYYKRAGFNCEYSGNQLKEPEIKYVMSISKVLFRMCELLRDKEYYSHILDTVKQIKRLGAYKYPEFALDEIEPTDRFVFVINQINKIMPKNKTELQFEAYRILRKNANLAVNKYSVEEKLTIRKAYIELLSGNNGGNLNKPDEELKEICDRIKKGVTDGLLGSNEFAIKIISTISSNGYRRCSDKQRRVLNDTINRLETKAKTVKQIETLENEIEKADEVNKTETFSIAGMSDLLGRGVI